MRGPSFKFEKKAKAQGVALICGIDEAGCGPWAGPVVAAAVILDPAKTPKGIDDSKKLSPDKREMLFAEITTSALCAIGIADVERIDRDNILAATLWAMGEAVKQLKTQPHLALVDGNRAPALPCPVQTIVEGDTLSFSIAAASIIAKVTRDRIMCEIDLAHPGYGFAQHKGYGTLAHRLALLALGPSIHHRKSFTPVRELLPR